MCDRARGFTRSVVLLAVLAVVTLMATSVAAQSTTGTILGNVTDADGLALPGATVTATNTETGATRTVVTDSEGAYFIGALQIGLYRVDVTMSGFRSFQQEAVLAVVGAERARGRAAGGRRCDRTVDVVANASTRRHAFVGRRDQRRSAADG